MAYHPQGDRQTERVNQELEQFLQLFINQRQDNWDKLLPFVEFQYNNHTHSTTQNVQGLCTPPLFPVGLQPDWDQKFNFCFWLIISEIL